MFHISELGYIIISSFTGAQMQKNKFYDSFKNVDVLKSSEILKEIQKNGVIIFGSSGEMGSKICSTFARASTTVIMQDIDKDKLKESKENALSTLEKAVAKRKLSKKQLEIIKEKNLINEMVVFPERGKIPFNEISDNTSAMIFLSSTIPNLKEKYSNSSMLLEAGPEIVSFKQDVFSFYNCVLNQNSILATNTSSLRVDDIASRVNNPDRVVGYHYFLPAHINPLIEIIAGSNTSEVVIQAMRDLAISMGKKPIISWKDSPGAVANRILVGVLNETAKLYSEGLGSQAFIDKIFLETFYPKQIRIATSKAQKQFYSAPKLSFFKDEKSLYKKIKEERNLTKKKELLEIAEGRLRQKVLYSQILENHACLGSFFTPADCVGKIKILAQDQIKKIRGAINNIEKAFEITSYDFPKPSITNYQSPSVISDRLKSAYVCISQEIYNEGLASIQDIEIACKEGFKWNVGPFELIRDLGNEEVLRLSKIANENFNSSEKTGISRSGDIINVSLSDVSGIQTYVQNEIGYIVLGRLHIQNLQMIQNSLGVDMLNTLSDTIKTFEKSGVKAVIIRSQGGGAFCSGADLEYINSLDWNTEKILAYRNLGKRVMEEVSNCKLPTLAVLDGPAVGGGLELALACDYRIMTDQAFVAMPEVALGIIPDWGGTEKLPAIIGKELAKRMICTAELKNLGLKLSGEDAFKVGLADAYVLQSELPILLSEIIHCKKNLNIYEKPKVKQNYDKNDYPESIVAKFGLNKSFRHKPRWITKHAAFFAEDLINHSHDLSYSKRVDDDSAFIKLIKSGKTVSNLYIKPFLYIAQNKCLANIFEKIGLV